MGTTKKSATKPNKRFWEGGVFRVMKRWIPNSKSGSRLFYQIVLTRTAELKMRTMAAVARKHLCRISTNKKHHKNATVATHSADNRVVEEPKPTHDEDNVTNDEATEDATIGDAIADEPLEVGTFAAHHTNNEHHEDATVAADSEDNQAKASEDMTTVHGIADEPSEDGDNSNVNEAPGDTSTRNGIADEPCGDEKAPEFNEDGDNSTDHEAPGDTNTDNGTVGELTQLGTMQLLPRLPGIPTQKIVQSIVLLQLRHLLLVMHSMYLGSHSRLWVRLPFGRYQPSDSCTDGTRIASDVVENARDFSKSLECNGRLDQM